MNRSFQSVVIAFFASILLISGCSSGSSTGVSFSKEAVTEDQCFAEYVSFYGDVQRNFMFTVGSLGTYDYDVFNNPDLPALNQMAATYGKDHYDSHGAKEGRQLPYGCERFLRPHPQCFRDYYFSDPSGFDDSVTQDDFDAINEMAQIHGTVDEFDNFAAIGFRHWINHGRDEGRAIPTRPSGISENHPVGIAYKSCKGMITHQPVCRPGSRFPNCNDNDFLGGALGAALVAATDAACGAQYLDTGVCVTPEVKAAGPVRTCVNGSVLIDGEPNGEECEG